MAMIKGFSCECGEKLHVNPETDDVWCLECPKHHGEVSDWAI